MVADAEEFLDGGLDDLLSFLDDLAALGSEAAPTPSAELAGLFAGTQLVRPARRRQRDAPLPTAEGPRPRRASPAWPRRPSPA